MEKESLNYTSHQTTVLDTIVSIYQNQGPCPKQGQATVEQTPSGSSVTSATSCCKGLIKKATKNQGTGKILSCKIDAFALEIPFFAVSLRRWTRVRCLTVALVLKDHHSKDTKGIFKKKKAPAMLVHAEPKMNLPPFINSFRVLHKHLPSLPPSSWPQIGRP